MKTWCLSPRVHPCSAKPGSPVETSAPARHERCMVSNTVAGALRRAKAAILSIPAPSAKFSGGGVAVNSVDNSKGLPGEPYRRFESCSVRQLVLSFCGWISSQVNTSTFPWVSRRTAATNVRRERKVGSHLGSFEPLSHVAPLAVRFSLIEKQDASAESEAMGVTARPIRPTSRHVHRFGAVAACWSTITGIEKRLPQNQIRHAPGSWCSG